MRDIRLQLLVTCALILSIAGCTYPAGDTVEFNFYGTTNMSDSTFQISGELAAEGGNPNKGRYSRIRVLCYDEDGSVLCGKTIGTWDVSEGPLSVSFKSRSMPKTIVFDSEDFWAETSEVEYLTYDRSIGKYVHEEATERSDLPVDVDERDPPQCRQ